MSDFTRFEIIQSNGKKSEYEHPKYYWGYGLVDGTIDREDKSVVVVYMEVDDEITTVMEYSSVVSVGYCDHYSAMSTPVLVLQSRCEKCGHKPEQPKKEPPKSISDSGESHDQLSGNERPVRLLGATVYRERNLSCEIEFVFDNNQCQGTAFERGDLASTVSRQLRELADHIDRNAKTTANPKLET